MKKIRAIIAITFLLVGMADMKAADGALGVKSAPPVLSFDQFRSLKGQFTSWLSKHYRCIYTGPCTKEEKEQVMREWGTWIKRIGVTAVVILTYMYRDQIRKAGADIREQFNKEAYEAGKSVARGALGLKEGEPIDLPQQAEQMSAAATRAALGLERDQRIDWEQQAEQVSVAATRGALGLTREQRIDWEQQAEQVSAAATRGALGLTREQRIDLNQIVKDFVQSAAAALLQTETQERPGVAFQPLTGVSAQYGPTARYAAPAVSRPSMTSEQIQSRLNEIAEGIATAAVKGATETPRDEPLRSGMRDLVRDLRDTALKDLRVDLPWGGQIRVRTGEEGTPASPEPAARPAEPYDPSLSGID